MSGPILKSWTIGNTRLDLYHDEINTCIIGIGETFAYPVGYPNVIESYREHAKHLGYVNDTMLMCVEHEAAHTLIAYWMGLPSSPVIHGIITGKTYEDFSYEESVVLEFQKLCRLHGVSILKLLDRYNNV